LSKEPRRSPSHHNRQDLSPTKLHIARLSYRILTQKDLPPP
jgi:hypothetical protein